MCTFEPCFVFSWIHSRLAKDKYQDGKAGEQGMLMKINVAKLFSRSDTTLLNTVFIELVMHSFHEDFTDPEFPDYVSLLLLHYLYFFATSSVLVYLSSIQIYWWPPCLPLTRAYLKTIYQNTHTCWGMRCPYLNSGRRWVAQDTYFNPVIYSI